MTVDSALEFLLEFFGATRVPSAKRTYLHALLDQIRPDDMRAAVVRTLAESCAHLPTVKQIRATWDDVRQAWWQRQKLAPLAPRDFGPEANPVHAARSFALISRLLAGQLRGPERLSEFRAMARDFPAVGWEEAVKDTEKALPGEKPEDAA